MSRIFKIRDIFFVPLNNVTCDFIENSIKNHLKHQNVAFGVVVCPIWGSYFSHVCEQNLKSAKNIKLTLSRIDAFAIVNF
jgi:hypothetical protein